MRIRIFLGAVLFVLFAPFSYGEDAADVIVKTQRIIEPFKRSVPWEIDLGGKGSIEIKLTSERGFPMVDAYLNHQGPFKFLVDTGADSSIISFDLAKKLKLEPQESKKQTFETAHKKAEIRTDLYIIPLLKLGNAVIKHAPFVASNTASDDFQLLQDLDITGIIGANLFHDIILTLDLSQPKMILSQSLHDIKGYPVKLDKKYYLPVIKSTVIRKDGESEYNLLVDSGYSGFIKMPICFPQKQSHHGHDAIVTYDVFKEPESGFIAELDGTLKIGDKELENPMVKYTMGRCEEKQAWGLIGTRYLQHQTLSIDQRNREVILH